MNDLFMFDIEEEEVEEVEEMCVDDAMVLDDIGLDHIKNKYKNMKTLKRQNRTDKKRKKREPLQGDIEVLYNKNILLSHSAYKQSVIGFIGKCKSLSRLESSKMDILVCNTANILHHCNLLWNGGLDFLYGDINIQLPKDCNLRIYASIYFVVTQLYGLLSCVNMKELLTDLYQMDKSLEKSRKKGTHKKTKERLFFDNLHRFLTIIRKYDLGGKKYKRAMMRFLTNESQMPRCDIEYMGDSPSTRFYNNLLRSFFDTFPDYVSYKSQCENLIEDAITNVVLEGKGIRLVHMVCIYNLVVVRNLPTDERKRSRKNVDPGLSSMKIHALIENKENISGVLYNNLMDHYMISLDGDIKAIERRKKNFIKCLQKYLKRS